MKPLSLSDLKPEASSFDLDGETFHLRPLSLNDELWLQKTFRGNIQTLFEKQDMVMICRIVFHQMTEESKQSFGKRKVKMMNEEGDQVEHEIGGYELLFWKVRGWGDKDEMIRALVQTVGISRDLFAELEKKSLADLEARRAMRSQSPLPPSTGEESSTSSHTNTDGQPSISGP